MVIVIVRVLFGITAVLLFCRAEVARNRLESHDRRGVDIEKEEIIAIVYPLAALFCWVFVYVDYSATIDNWMNLLNIK